MPTIAPALASSSAVAWPMPTPAPVTSATRPARLYSGMAFMVLSAVLVTLRMCAMPVPRGFHDRLNIGIARLPAELFLNFLRRRHQHRRVAGAARAFLDGNFLAGHRLDGGDHLAHAVAAADAEIVVHR